MRYVEYTEDVTRSAALLCTPPFWGLFRVQKYPQRGPSTSGYLGIVTLSLGCRVDFRLDNGSEVYDNCCCESAKTWLFVPQKP